MHTKGPHNMRFNLSIVLVEKWHFEWKYILVSDFVSGWYYCQWPLLHKYQH